MATWVDFKAVKEAVSMQAVLDHYGLSNGLRRNGNELRGRCPIHGGKESESFQANTQKNNFNCFTPSCKAHGNVLDFVAAMEKCTVRDAAVKLAEWFSVYVPANGGGNEAAAIAVEKKSAAENSGAGECDGELVNRPLTFQLKGVDCSHVYLMEREISRETAETFGVGFFAGKGSMSGRVVIPIHNEAGELVAYAGRAIDGSEPRYKLPAGFHKAAELYNLHRAVEVESRGLIVVEGFFDAMVVHQAGYPFVVALMGSTLSEAQEELLVSHAGMVLLMLDGDEAGKRATDEIGGRLLRSVFVKAVELPAGKQPDMMTAAELTELMGI